MGTVSSSDPRLAYASIYVGSCADDASDPYLDGNANIEYNVPAGCYGDGIGVKATFSNGVQGFVYLSKAPADFSNHLCTYGITQDSCIGSDPDNTIIDESSPSFTWDYCWNNVILGDTNKMYYDDGCHDFYLWRDYDSISDPITMYTHQYTYGGMRFYMYFIVFKSNSILEYPLTIASNVPSLTLDFPFLAVDYQSDPDELEEIDPNDTDSWWRGEDGYYFNYCSYVNDYELINEIARASGLTILGTQSSAEGWSCNAAYMTRPLCILGTITNSLENEHDYKTIFVASTRYYKDSYPFEPNSSVTSLAECYGDGIGAHVVFANNVEGYVMLSKIPNNQYATEYCLTWAKCRAETIYESGNEEDSNKWYGSSGAFIAHSTNITNSQYHVMDYEEYQASGGDDWEDYYDFTAYLPNITVDGIKFYLHYVYFKKNENITFQSNVPTINLNFNCYRCDANGNQSDVGFYYHTNRQALMQAIVNASGLTVNS